MKRLFNITVGIAVMLSMVSCAKGYQQGALKKPDVVAATQPAGTVTEDADLYALHIADSGKAVDLSSAASKAKWGDIKLSGLGMQEAPILDMQVAITIHRVTKTAGVLIHIIYESDPGRTYTINLTGGTASGSGGVVLFSAADKYSTVLVNMGLYGSIVQVSMRDQKFGSVGYFMNGVTGFQTNPPDSY